LDELTARRKQMLRFVLSGGSAAGVYFMIAYGLHMWRWPPFMANLTAYVLAFGFGYLLQRGWTFEARHRHTRALPRYFAVQVACALFTSVAAHVLVRKLGLTPLLVSILTTGLAGVGSYLASSLWVFSPANIQPPE
jgi:putative flippase GtrA